MDPVDEVVATLQHRDCERLKVLLHPYLHWTEDGVTTRGRTKVLARLADAPSSGRPVSYELRDGQIYRWTVGS